METQAHIIERVQTPRGELQLQRRGSHMEIISNGTFLMATYNGDSERMLVAEALKMISSPRRIVIGGLGVGFSLAEALRVSSITEAVVVEIEDKIIDWNRTHLSFFSEQALDDARTRIVQEDFLVWMEKENTIYDAICLDIDNGPDWTVTAANNSLYQEDSLRLLHGLVKPGGTVAFWSASPVPSFHRLLKNIFHHVSEIKIPHAKGPADCIYIAATQT